MTDQLPQFCFLIGTQINDLSRSVNMRALAEKLSLLLQNPDQWIVMSRNARQRFLEKFEFSKNLTRQVQWFEEIYLQSDAHLHHYRQL